MKFAVSPESKLKGQCRAGLVLGLALLAARFQGAQIRPLTFTASDGIGITADWRLAGEKPGLKLIVLAPGFAQNKGTRSMRTLAECLTKVADVLVVDFRGTGGSQGRYWFGSKEFLDLDAALKWSRSNYPDVTLLGLSLGAYHAARAVAEGGRPDRLLLVSCPVTVDKVVLSGGALWHVINFLFRDIRFKIQPQSAPFFRWGPIFAAKPDASVLAGKITIPTFCLVGGKDTLVFESQSRKVFECLAGPRHWKKMDGGAHAEGMFLQDPEGFTAWVRESMETTTTSGEIE